MQYEIFEAAIDSNIESLYDILSDWKTKLMNNQMKKLNQINFGTQQQPVTKKKIIIMIQDV